MNIFKIRRTFKAARRVREIINVLLRHGFGNIIDQLHLGKYIPLLKRIRGLGRWPSLIKGPYTEVRLRLAFAELGPSFIKLAQIISTRPDLVSSKVSEEFKKLQDQVPPFLSSEARRIIAEDLAVPFETVFSRFDETPIAAASIAQVHAAALPDGTEVIVKVQRPNICETIESDIEILGNLAMLLEANYPEARNFNPTGIVAEFDRTVHKELDFAAEGRNCIRFKAHFLDNKQVYFPRIYPEYLTGRVIVMERLRGVRMDDLQGIRALGFDTRELARSLMDAYFKMIVTDGFFHADPHPGNLFVMPSGQIGFTDFGIVGYVTEDIKTLLANIFIAFATKDFDRVVDLQAELGMVPDDADLESYRREFKAELAEFVMPLYGLKLKEIDFPAYLAAVVRIIIKHNLKIPTELVLVDKTLLMLHSLCTQLDPDFDIMEASKPYMDKIAMERMSPGRIAERAAKGFGDVGDLLRVLPRQVRRIMHKVVRDEVVVKLSIKGLETLIKDMDRSTNRLSVAMIISAVLISSAIMHATNVGPSVFGMSLLGFIVFGLAAVLGIGLIISIFRSGRL